MLRPMPCASILLLAALLVSCGGEEPAVPADGTGLLYVWAGDADSADADFLAVVDARRGSPTYGQVLRTDTVPGRGHLPHHTEHALTPGRELWANGWGSGRTFRFDLSDPLAPRLAGSFTTRGDYAYPHSYARLANGHVLATFQTSGAGYTPSGGLVELDARGEFVRAVSGASPDVPPNETWTYSVSVFPDLDRAVSTNTRMGLPAEWASAAHAATDPTHQHVSQDVRTTHIQVWRLSDLALLHTLRLPPQDGGHEGWPAEVRRVANGEVYVNTFSCGLYRLAGLAGERPVVEPVTSSRFVDPGHCAVPVVLGDLWIEPSATERTITAYDLSDPANPRVASRLTLDSAYATPHWLALDPTAPRLVVTFNNESWVLLVDIDPTTGALSVDEAFKDPGAVTPGVNFDRGTWPHGARGRANPHGAVFGVPAPDGG